MIAKDNLTDKQAYSLQSEAQRIYESIVNDPRLNVPSEVKALVDQIQFVGDETQPFFPVPFKAAESQAGLLGCVGLFALAIARERYGIDEKSEIDVAHALLNGLGSAFHPPRRNMAFRKPENDGCRPALDHGKTQ
jgi:hypothetical protein